MVWRRLRDLVEKMNRRFRVKLFTSNRIIVTVFLLALICVLWTTEWMDRLRVFGNTIGDPLPNSPSPIDSTPDVGVYHVPLGPGSETPYTHSPTFISDLIHNSHEDLPSPVDPEGEEDLRRLKICVVSSNPRTASLFHSKTLRRKGKGKFDYIVTSRRCPLNATTAPVVVKMLYQKSLSEMSSPQLNSLFNSPENLIIVMGDEFCRCPVEVCSMRAHARQYYSQSYVDYVTQHPSADANPTVYLPLGPRIEFPVVRDSEVVRSSKRKLLFNLIVSPTSPSRKKLAVMVNNGDFESIFVHVTPAFAGNASQAKGFVSPEEYKKTLLDSKFTLCPAGHNPEAFRLFEASEAGSIPVVVKDEEYLQHDCRDSFAPLLASGAPFIVLNSWENLAESLKPYVADPAMLDERQNALKEWYKRFWEEIARDFECSITQNIDKILKKPSSSVISQFSTDKYDMPDCRSDVDETEDELVPSPPALSGGDDDAVPEVTEKDPLQSKFVPTPLIVGCGRTGTLSLSHYLVNSAKVKSVHERMEPFTVSVSWLYAIPDAPIYPFEGKKSLRFRRLKAMQLKKIGLPLFSPVVHIVRHPLKVISSTRRCFCGRGTRSTGLGQASDARSWQFVDQNIKMPKPNLPLDSLLRSMTYWYEWNILIPKKHKVAARFRIEDLDPNQLVQNLSLTLTPGIDLPHRVPRAPSHVSPEKEKELLPDATWKSLYDEDESLASRIFSLAKEYGYEQEATKLEELF